MSDPASRKSILKNFAPVWRRAFSDKRLRARHYRVLGAICTAINRESATALISQERISQWANYSRQKVGAVVADLEEWGYISRVPRGRRKNGRFKTLMYEVRYETPAPSLDTAKGDTAPVTPGSDDTESPPEVAESDPSNSDFHTVSDSNETGGPDGSAWQKTDAASHGPLNQSCRMQVGERAMGTLRKRPLDAISGRTLSSKTRQSLGKARAEDFERHQRNHAVERINRWLFEDLPNGDVVTAMNALDGGSYEAAVDAEMRRPGAGIDIAKSAVRQAISRKSERVRTSE